MAKITILQIEDDAFLARIYSQKLEGLGFDVILAGSGEEGLKIVQREKPACVLLDILLPGMDGFEVLEVLKDNPATADIPVVMVTNLGQREDIEKAMRLGAAGYMIKSHIKPQDIATKINEVLNIE